MCCLKCANIEQELRNKAKNGKVVCYKVLMVAINYNTKTDAKPKPTPVVNSIWGEHQWKPGINEADISAYLATQPSLYQRRNPKGIHVYIYKCDAEKMKDRLSESFERDLILIEVHCNIKDLIRAGKSDAIFSKDSEEAVFTKVKVTPQQWKKCV